MPPTILASLFSLVLLACSFTLGQQDRALLERCQAQGLHTDECALAIYGR
jgi:hypothetical protein